MDKDNKSSNTIDSFFSGFEKLYSFAENATELNNLCKYIVSDRHDEVVVLKREHRKGYLLRHGLVTQWEYENTTAKKTSREVEQEHLISSNPYQM